MGISQQDLAEKLGIHAMYVSNLERSLCGLPAKRYREISRILKIDIETLISAYLKDQAKKVRDIVGA